MKTLLEFTCYTVPVPQPRQRHAVINGNLRNFTPAKHPVQDFKAALKAEAQKHVTAPHDGPLHLVVTFYMPRPQKLMRKRDPDGPVPHTAKPDADNLVKAVKDALNKLVWRDDSQICGLIAFKWYAGKAELPRVHISLNSPE